jgi:transposase
MASRRKRSGEKRQRKRLSENGGSSVEKNGVVVKARDETQRRQKNALQRENKKTFKRRAFRFSNKRASRMACEMAYQYS